LTQNYGITVEFSNKTHIGIIFNKKRNEECLRGSHFSRKLRIFDVADRQSP